MDSKGKRVGSKHIGDNTGIVRLCEGKEASILWSNLTRKQENCLKKRLRKEQCPVEVGEEDQVRLG